MTSMLPVGGAIHHHHIKQPALFRGLFFETSDGIDWAAQQSIGDSVVDSLDVANVSGEF